MKLPYWGNSQDENDKSYFLHKNGLLTLIIQPFPFIYNIVQTIPVKEMKAISLILKNSLYSMYIKPELGLMWGFTKPVNAHKLGLTGETYWVSTDGFKMVLIAGTTLVDGICIHPDIVNIASKGNFDFAESGKKNEVYFNTKYGYAKVTWKLDKLFPDINNSYVIPESLKDTSEFIITSKIDKSNYFLNDIHLGKIYCENNSLLINVTGYEEINELVGENIDDIIVETYKGKLKIINRTIELGQSNYPIEDKTFNGINIIYLSELLNSDNGLWKLNIKQVTSEKYSLFVFTNQTKTIFAIIMGMLNESYRCY